MDIGVIILAIIQGISEFLPISSSAHLIIFRDLFLIGKTITEDLALSFDIALHFGTFLAILVVFFKDFWNMLMGFIKKENKLLIYLVLATIPAGVVGVLFDDLIDGIIRNNYIVIALALLIMGVLLYIVDTNSKEEKDLDKINLKDALLIGTSQVFALIPGFSRSGTTITMARYLKLDRETAAKFSFYLSAPVVFGATLLQLLKKETIALIIPNLNIFIIGILVSFIIGILCIKFLLSYIKKNDFKVFAIYRAIFSIIIIIKLFIR